MHGRSLVPASVLPQEQRPRKMISPQTDTSLHTQGRRSKEEALGLGARRHPGGQMAQYKSTFRGASDSQVTVTAHMWSHHTHPDHHNYRLLRNYRWSLLLHLLTHIRALG